MYVCKRPNSFSFLFAVQRTLSASNMNSQHLLTAGGAVVIEEEEEDAFPEDMDPRAEGSRGANADAEMEEAGDEVEGGDQGALVELEDFVEDID